MISQPSITHRSVVTQRLNRIVVSRFQGHKFVFTLRLGNDTYKIFQVSFSKKDGTLFVSLPYLNNSEGIVAVARLAPFVNKADIDLAHVGKVTSSLVKYSHHPDGEAHFSQSGKILTQIRKKAVPLANLSGHVFSLRFQGLSQFKKIDPDRDGRPPTSQRTVLNFDYKESKAAAFNIIANWYEPAEVVRRLRLEDGAIGPAFTTGGGSTAIFVVGNLDGKAFEDKCLLISSAENPVLDLKRENVFTFLGGFDPVAEPRDMTKGVSFLAAEYPCSDFQMLQNRIGSIDFSPDNA